MKKKHIAVIMVLSFVISLFSGVSVFAADKTIYSISDLREDIDTSIHEAQVVSIDVLIPEDAIDGYTFRYIDDDPTDTGGKPYGYLRFRTAGGIAHGIAAPAWDVTSSLEEGTRDKTSYTIGEPLNITARLNRMTGTVDFYLNGKWYYRQWYNSSDRSAAPASPINPWHMVMVVSEQTNVMPVVNLRYNIGLKADELGAYIALNETQKTVTVDFTESIGDVDFEDTCLKCVSDGTEIGLSVKSASNSSVTFTYTGDLVSANEYAVVLPEGIKGEPNDYMAEPYALSSRYLYFSTNSMQITADKQETFDDGYDVTKNFILREQTSRVIVTDLTENGGGKSGEGVLVNSGTVQNTLSSLYWQNCPNDIKNADIQTVSFDIKPLREDLSAAIRFTDGGNNTRPILTGFSKAGNILAGYAWDSADVMEANTPNESVCTYEKDRWYNIRLEWDSVNKTGAFYITPDGSSETIEKTFTAPNFGKFSSYITVVYKDLMQIRETNNTDLFVLDNVRFLGANDCVSVNKVRFRDMNGNSVGACEAVNRLLDGIDVYFSDKIDETSLEGSAELSYNGVPVEFTLDYNEAANCAVLTPLMLPPKDAAVAVSVSGIQDAGGGTVPPYACTAIADSAEDGLTVETLDFVTADGTEVEALDGGEVYIKAVAANTADTDKELVISAMGYSNSALSAFDYRTVTVPAGTIYRLKETEAYPIMLNADSADSIRAAVQNKEDSCPLKEVYIEKTAALDGELTVTGQVKNAAKDTDVSIEVYVPDKTFADLDSAEDFRDVLIYKTIAKTAEDGGYSAHFNVDYANAKSGMYTVIATAKDYLNNSTVLYVNPDETARVLNDELNPAISKGDIDKAGDILYNNRYALYIDDKYITEALADAAAAILINSAKENTLTVNNAKIMLNKAVAIAGVNSGAITDIIGAADVFELDSSTIKDVYKADYVTDATKQELVTRMRKANCTSVDAFDKKLAEEFVLTVVANPVRPGSIAAVLQIVGLSGYSAEAYNSVANKEYPSIAALKEVLDGYKPSVVSSSPSGNSNTGLGGYVTTAKGGGYSAPVSTDTSNTEPRDIFSDLTGYEWAKDSIVKLYEKGVVSGTGTGNFEPYRTVNREEYVKMLCEAFDFGTGGTAADFADVAETAWYAPYVSRAVELGIVKGVSEDLFGVGTQISREDMAVIIYRALMAENKEFDERGADFTDASEIADYAKDAVEILSGAGIINGVGEGRFAPKSSASRAEAAVIILRCIEKFSL